MRRRSVLWALTVVALAGLSPALAAQDSRPGIAVMPFTNGGSYGKDKEDFQALEKGLAGMLISELSQNPAARLVDREAIQKILDEPQQVLPARLHNTQQPALMLVERATDPHL